MRLAFWKKKEKKDKKKKSVLREWVDAALFAIIAATIIRTFLIEAYTIPTPSMEGSLLVNDYLFVSKVAYGPRVPMTPIAFPLVHNTMPIVGGKSYSEAVQWNYHRWPGFGDVERYDIVVFNFPNGDTVIAEMPDRDYYSKVRELGWQTVHSQYTIITRPIDKKENYIKRCIGIPGDKIEIKNGIVYVNGKQSPNFPHSKMTYNVSTQGFGLSQEFLEENSIEIQGQQGNMFVYNIPNDKVEVVRKLPTITYFEPSVTPVGYTADDAFPNDPENFKWNRDNYGPFVLPKKGASVSITPQNIALYRRIIDVYEENDLEEKGGKLYINGKEANSYTFKMDYYWMMGDNRHNSLDSRYFGFVPEDHIVGKAWFVWLSHGNGIRWNRLFRSVTTLSE